MPFLRSGILLRHSKAQRQSRVTSLLRSWSEHRARILPNPSARAQFVEYRRVAAAFDGRVSRYIDEVCAGGDWPPVEGDEVEARRQGLTKLPVETEEEAEELDFYLASSFEIGEILDEARSFQEALAETRRQAPPPPP